MLAGKVRVGEGDAARLDRKPGDLLAQDVPVVGRWNPSPYVSRGGHKLAAALDAFGDRPGRTRLPRRRRVHRRLHRRPVAARRDAGLRSRRGSRTAGRIAPARPAGRVDGADERPRPDRVRPSRSRSASPSIDVSFISLALVLPPVAATLGPGSARRRPRQAAVRSRARADATTASCAIRRSIARSCERRRGRGARRSVSVRGPSSPRRSPDRRATASSSCTWRPGPGCADDRGAHRRGDRAHDRRRGSGSPTTRPTRDAIELARAGGGLVPGPRHRPLDAAGGRSRRSARRELPTTDVVVVLGGDGTFLRAVRAVAEVDVPILGHQPRQGRLPLEGRGERARGRAGARRRRRVPDRRADGARGPDPAPRPADRSATATSRSTTSSSRAARSPGCAGSTWRSTARTSRRSSPTACRGQPDRLHRLLVLGRRPDRRPGQPQPRS